tara:strand:- start:358 stop:759 length:402 start_codon:yes stop_codon:yes gene_type:complete
MPLYGPKFPLSSGNEDAFELYETVEGQIAFYLKNLILTSPGEKISDSNYGVGLRRFIFEQAIPATYSKISSKISSQISTYLPYISVIDIQAGASDVDIDSNSMFVKIAYKIPNDAVEKIFELEINPESMIGFY